MFCVEERGGCCMYMHLTMTTVGSFCCWVGFWDLTHKVGNTEAAVWCGVAAILATMSLVLHLVYMLMSTKSLPVIKLCNVSPIEVLGATAVILGTLGCVSYLWAADLLKEHLGWHTLDSKRSDFTTAIWTFFTTAWALYLFMFARFYRKQRQHYEELDGQTNFTLPTANGRASFNA